MCFKERVCNKYGDSTSLKSFFGRNIFFFFVHCVVGIVVKISAYNLTGIHDETFDICLKNDVIDRGKGSEGPLPFPL